MLNFEIKKIGQQIGIKTKYQAALVITIQKNTTTPFY
jgi:hypothetical protein